MADDTGLGVAVDVGLPLPAGRVWVSRANVFGLETLQLLLCTELVGLWKSKKGDLHVSYELDAYKGLK